MAYEEYEILPQKLLEDLKYDVEALKKKLSEPETVSEELIASMEELKLTIKEMNNIYKEVLQDVKEEDSAKLLSSLKNQVEAVTAQNETIARGMVAISDKLEDFMEKHKAPEMPHPETTISAPSMPSAPSETPTKPSGLPPPPKKRMGIFK